MCRGIKALLIDIFCIAKTHLIPYPFSSGSYIVRFMWCEWEDRQTFLLSSKEPHLLISRHTSVPTITWSLTYLSGTVVGHAYSHLTWTYWSMRFISAWWIVLWTQIASVLSSSSKKKLWQQQEEHTQNLLQCLVIFHCVVHLSITYEAYIFCDCFQCCFFIC